MTSFYQYNIRPKEWSIIPWELMYFLEILTWVTFDEVKLQFSSSPHSVAVFFVRLMPPDYSSISPWVQPCCRRYSIVYRIRNIKNNLDIADQGTFGEWVQDYSKQILVFIAASFPELQLIMWFCRHKQFLDNHLEMLVSRMSKLKRAELGHRTKKWARFSQNWSTLSARYALHI